MTAAEFCRTGITHSESVFPELAPPSACDWLVRFRYSLRGEAPVIAQVTVKNALSEAAAIRDAIVRRLGRVNRALDSLEMLEVRRIA